MNLKNFSSSELVSKVKNLAAEERKITAEILAYLQEIEYRRAYLEHGCASLWDFCRKVLLYSEGSAQRRIQSMRLLREIPELKPAVETGSLSLMTLTQVRLVDLPRRQKKNFILSLQNKSKREVERRVAALKPEAPAVEKVRSLGDRKVEIRMVISEELLEDLENLKDLLGKKVSGKMNSTHAELIQYLVREKKKELLPPSPPPPVIVTKTVTEKMRAYLLHKAGYRCTYRDPKTKKRCVATRALEIDHLKPRALGGDHRVANLRVLCKTHNLFTAQQVLGAPLMDLYWQRR